MAKYLRYVIKNIEPIRIADESTSQSGQTNTLRYVPGTTIRGLVITALAKEEDFEEKWKDKLFSKETVYTNAFLMAGQQELLPSPKGFYEDKSVVEGKKELQNVVINGEFAEGYKRASLGRYGYFEGDCIRYYNVDTGSDLKIKINTVAGEKKNVFRNEYIMPGQMFCGYVKIGFPELEDRLKAIFRDCVILGNARSAGLGKCKVISCDVTDTLPYEVYLPEGQEGHCYMMLLSNTAMRSQNGELCGIDLEQLQEKMGVQKLEVKECATSTVTVQGYNRTWQTRVPSVVMYEQGSVFKLVYEGVLTRERMMSLCNDGIGIRRNEGCGRILFLRDYEGIKSKLPGDGAVTVTDEVKSHEEDSAMCRLIAKRLYMLYLEKAMEQSIVSGRLFKTGTISRSQLGELESMISAHRYNPSVAKEMIELYLEKTKEKEENRKIHKNLTSTGKVHGFMQKLLTQTPEEMLKDYLSSDDKIMGIDKTELLSEEEILGFKLRLVTELIRYENKKESR